MPVGTVRVAGKDRVTDCPRMTVLPIIGPITDEVVSFSIAHVPYSAPWKVALTSWIESFTGTCPPLPSATKTTSREFGSQPLAVQFPEAVATAHRFVFLISAVPETDRKSPRLNSRH